MHRVTSLGKISALRRCPRIMSSVNWNFADSNAVASPRSALELASARAYNIGPFSVVASADALRSALRDEVLACQGSAREETARGTPPTPFAGWVAAHPAEARAAPRAEPRMDGPVFVDPCI